MIFAEYNLSVIENPEHGRGKSHYEWELNKSGQSWKSQLKNTIDETVTESASFDDFLSKLKEKK